MKTLNSTNGRMVKGYQEYLALEQHKEHGEPVYVIVKKRTDTPSYASIMYRTSNYGEAVQQWSKLSDKALTICD